MKTIQLSYSHLYSLSTLNVNEVIDTQDGFREVNPINIDMVVIKGYTAQAKDEITVSIGDHIRLLYGDGTWVYGSTGQTGKAGFLPRTHCRLTRHSYNTLYWSHWLLPQTQFQADFKFNMSQSPPDALLGNPHFPHSSAKGEVRTLLRNYVVPGSQYIVRRGSSVRTQYYEEGGFFRFVATITGTSFWIPTSFTVAPPPFPILPVTVRQDLCTSLGYDRVVRPRPRAHTISGGQECGVMYRKKVSFAVGSQLAVIQSARSSLCQSNPELSLTDEEADPHYSTIPRSTAHPPPPPPRRSQSNEDLSPSAASMLSSNSLCCHFLCF